MVFRSTVRSELFKAPFGFLGKNGWILWVVLFAFLERGHRKRREDPLVSELLADLLSGSSLDSFPLGPDLASATGVHVISALNILITLSLAEVK
jgi:hypothetical protein